MIRAGLVLAAGASRRFGGQNKLVASFRGRKLAEFAAGAIRDLPLDHRIVVVGSPETAVLFDGFEVLQGGGPASGQGESLRIGAEYARRLGADRLLICLADMPFISPEILQKVLMACRADRASAVTDGVRRTPPACFPGADLPMLVSAGGDQGARALLEVLPREALVRVAPDRLEDVDHLEDLDRLQAR